MGSDTMPASLKAIIAEGSPSLITWLVICGGLYLASLYSYTLFHSIAEIFSIIIASSLFLIAWNTRHLTKSNYILFLGIALLFAGIVDLAHTLAYPGMGIFQGFDTNLPTQLWIIARYMQSLSLLAAPWFIDRKLNLRAVFGVYLSVTFLLSAAAFSGTLFPDCFIEGRGLTPFKIASEYLICAILIASLVLLVRRREAFDPRIMRLLVWSILCTIASELAFTLYISAYGPANLIGHYFKIFAFYLVYRAIIVTGLEKPYSLLLFDVHKQREELQIIIDSAPIMIFYKDRENRFIRVNKALAEAVGLPIREIEGKTGREVYPNQLPDYWEDDKEVIASGIPKRGVVRQFEMAGGMRWLQTDKIPYRDVDGRIIGVIGFGVDVTERKKMEEEIRDLSFRDSLTALYNRRGFITLAEQQLKAAPRAQGKMLLVFLDVDNLKKTNDTLGHEMGDKVLIDAADVLRRTFRESDIIARVGGDEFAVLAIEMTDLNPDLLPNRLQQTIDACNADESKPYRLSLSWGMTVYEPEITHSLDQLMSAADMLMYAQKRAKSPDSI